MAYFVCFSFIISTTVGNWCKYLNQQTLYHESLPIIELSLVKRVLQHFILDQFISGKWQSLCAAQNALYPDSKMIFQSEAIYNYLGIAEFCIMYVKYLTLASLSNLTMATRLSNLTLATKLINLT